MPRLRRRSTASKIVDESGAPLDPSALPGRRALAGERPEPLVVGFRSRLTTELRWSLVRARLVDAGPRGERLVVSTFHDMTAQVEAGQASVAGERRYREIVDALPVAAWVAEPDGTIAVANDRWFEFTGRIAATGEFPAVEHLHEEDRAEFAAAWAAARAQEEALDATVRLRRHDGAYRWHVIRVVPLCRETGTIEGWIGTATDIDEERTSRKRAADLARLVADAGLHLDEANDLDETIQAAGALAIPELADWCLIDLVEPDGSLRRAAAVAGDPEAQRRLDGIRSFPTAVGSSRPAARAVRTRRPVLIEDLTDPVALRRATGDIAEIAGIVEAMGSRSVIVQPLLARGEPIGAMFFVVGPERSYTAAEVEVTSELAHRVALAISNAQVHAAEQEARRAAEAAAARLERLQRVTRELVAESTRDGVVNFVVQEGRAAFAASGAVVALLGERGLSVVATEGYDPAARSQDVVDPAQSRACRSRSRPERPSPSGCPISTTPRPTTISGPGSSRRRRTARPARCRSSPTGSRSGRSACRSRSRTRSASWSATTSARTPTSAPRPSPGSR